MAQSQSVLYGCDYQILAVEIKTLDYLVVHRFVLELRESLLYYQEITVCHISKLSVCL